MSHPDTVLDADGHVTETKQPRRVTILDRLPRSATGKVLKSRLAW